MTMSLTTPVTGGAQTGFTTPTFTLSADMPPDASSGRQYAVTAIGGTQPGALAHAADLPFTVTLTRPKVYKMLPAPVLAGLTYIFPSFPRNVYTIRVRKGVTVSSFSGVTKQVLQLVCTLEVPAGAETNDPGALRSATSLLVGALNQNSVGYGDSIVTGLL